MTILERSERVVSTIERMQQQIGTGPGVYKSTRPLLAYHTCFKCSMENLQNSLKFQLSKKDQFR